MVTTVTRPLCSLPGQKKAGHTSDTDVSCDGNVIALMPALLALFPVRHAGGGAREGLFGFFNYFALTIISALF